MPTYDYRCPDGHFHEFRCSVSAKPETHTCPSCGAEATPAITTAPPIPKVIVLDYPGSKKLKAGYMHTHGDRKATKVQVGYGGSNVVRDEPVGKPDANGNIWHADR